MTDEPIDNDNKAKIRVAEIVTKGDVINRTVQTLAKYGAAVGIAYFFYKAVEVSVISLNGKTTTADVRFEAIIDWVSDPNSTSVISALFGIAGIIYGRLQFNLKKDVVERFHQYQEKYETLVDPGRTSSRLTKRGETRPEDI